jgi:hypothetical protein
MKIAELRQWQYVPLYIISLALFFIFINKPFFWDKDLTTSAQAHWFYANGFNIFGLPDALNPGHPPLLGLIVALSWKIFGQHLWSAHLVMLPFVIGFVFQAKKLCKLIGLSNILIVMLLLLADTTLLVQFIIVSEDLVLMFFFVYAINSVLENKKLGLMFSLCGLALVNSRGMMICASIFVFYIYKVYNQKPLKGIILSLWVFLPGAILGSGFLLLHYIFKGWVIQNENSPWAECYRFAGAKGMLRNIFIVAWRYADFGKIVYWMVLAIIIIKFKSIKFLWGEKLKDMVVLFILLLLVLTPSMVVSYMLSDHRYILPTTFIFSLIVITSIQQYLRKPAIAYIAISAVLVSGSFWVYPDKIAKGWPSTMAHIPYHKLHRQMLVYIENNKIDLKTIGSLTPNLSPLRNMYVNNDNRKFAHLDFEKNEYVFYSNICNDFTDEEIDELRTNWTVQHAIRSIGVKVILYKKPVKQISK